MRRAVAAVVVLVAASVAGPVAGASVAGADVATDADGQPPQRSAETPTPSVSTANADATTTQTIRKTIELSLTPSEPGAVDVSVRYDVPDAVTGLDVSVPEEASDVETGSFERTSDGYEWGGETDPATLSFTMPVNRSASGRRAPDAADGDYSFVDTGPWALVRVPGLSTGWEWRSSGDVDVTLIEDVVVDGEGSTGGEIAYLGPVETYARTASDQAFTLVVPDHASLTESPSGVLDALAAAASRFHGGGRDDAVWFVAAPTSADWGVRGVEYGGTDAWVHADARLDEPGNVWFHEYVHTRQSYRTATSGRWTTEAAAEYYSALLGLRTGYVDFDSFATFLAYGEREPWRDAVLAEPDTWPAGANYVKGSLVWGAIDRRVRLATNSTATMADVFWRLNQRTEPVTNADVLAAVADVSTASVRQYARQYTETRSTPEMWTRSEHAAAFSTWPAHIELDVREYRVTGPFRNETFSTPPTLYVGETVVVEALVANDGGRTGEYAATLALDGDVLANASGTLAPAESETVTLSHEFATAGTFNVSAGRRVVELSVREPATVEVSDLSVADSTVRAGGNATATVTLSNPTDDYASGSVDVTLDGERVATLDAVLEPGETATRTVTVALSSAGEYVLAAGDESVTVTASERGGLDGETGTGIPGFGALAALAAVAVAAVLAVRER